MSLTYSASALSGSVIVWQEAEVYVDFTNADGDFSEKVERAREIVDSVNDARGVKPWTNSDLPWSERGRA